MLQLLCLQVFRLSLSGRHSTSSHRYSSRNFPVSSGVHRPRWQPLYDTNVIFSHEGFDQPNIPDNSTQPIMAESCVPEHKIHRHTHVHQRLPLVSCVWSQAPWSSLSLLTESAHWHTAHRQITRNLLPVAAAMATGGPYTVTYCDCQHHSLTQHNLSKDPPTLSVNLTEGVLM